MTGAPVVTSRRAAELPLRALKAGVKGYLLKDSAESDLIDAIKAVHEGKPSLAPRSAGCWSKITCGRSEPAASRIATNCSPRASVRFSDSAEPQPLHGGDAPPESSRQAQPAQLFRTGPVRRPQRRHILSVAARERCEPFRPEAFQYMSANFIARPASSSRKGFVSTS